MDDLRLISVVVVPPAPVALSWARKAVLKGGRWALAWQAETTVSHLWQPAVQDG